jgi:hypothetical protein
MMERPRRHATMIHGYLGNRRPRCQWPRDSEAQRNSWATGGHGGSRLTFEPLEFPMLAGPGGLNLKFPGNRPGWIPAGDWGRRWQARVGGIGRNPVTGTKKSL